MINYNGFIIADKIGAKCPKQTGLFTSKHEKFYLYITVTTPEGVKNVFKTTYQYYPGAIKFKNGDGLEAVLMDATAAADAANITDFMDLFGYSNTADARRAFNACKRALDFFTRAGLTTADLNNLLELVTNEK